MRVIRLDDITGAKDAVVGKVQAGVDSWPLDPRIDQLMLGFGLRTTISDTLKELSQMR